MTVQTRNYSILDVFATRRFTGNPLAVVHDARGLSTEQMQTIAQEFGLSETSFILPPDKGGLAEVRVFTPEEEVPFAGHPNIGAGYVIATRDTCVPKFEGRDGFLEQKAGPVQVTLRRRGNTVESVAIKAPSKLQLHGDLSPDRLVEALGISLNALSLTHFMPCVASVGLPFAFVELRGLEALASLAPSVERFRDLALIAPYTVAGFSVCAFVILDSRDGITEIRSRVLTPLGQPVEDPATGSASGALAALLRQCGCAGPDFRITQGVEVGRPGRIEVSVPQATSQPIVQGSCIDVAYGVLML